MHVETSIAPRGPYSLARSARMRSDATRFFRDGVLTVAFEHEAAAHVARTWQRADGVLDVRIDGPHVWIEFACQGSDHYHTIWRDRATDYGAEFSF